VIGHNPVLSKQEMMALKPERFNRLNRASAIPPNNSQGNTYFHQLDEHLQAKSKNLSGAAYVSIKPYICPKYRHYLREKDGHFPYSYAHHLSPYGHDLLFPVLQNLAKS